MSKIVLPDALQQNLAIGTWESDPSKDQITWSEHLYQIMGQTPESFNQRLDGYLACIHTDDRKRVLTDIQSTLTEKKPFSHEYRILRPDGEERWLHTFGDIIWKNAGQEMWLQGACQDITERIQAKEAEQIKQNHYQQLFESTEDLIFIHPFMEDRSKLRFENVNLAACKVLGYSLAELLEMGPQDLISEQQQVEISPEFELLKKQTDILFSKWLRTRSGELKLYEMRSHTFWENNSQKVFTLARSLSEREQKESQALQVEQRLQTLLELYQTSFETENSLIERALEKAVELTHSEIGYFHFVNPDQESLSLGIWSRKVHDICTTVHDMHYPLSMAGVWADCARLREPVIHNDYPSLSHKKGLPEGHFPLLRHMSVPVIENDKVRVILGVGNKSSDYTETDTRQMQLLAAHIWKLISKYRSEQALKDNQALFEAVFQNTVQLTGVLSPEGKIKDLNQKALEMIGAQREDVLNQPFELTPWWTHNPTQQAALKDLIKQANQGLAVSMQANHIDKTGKLHEIEFSLLPLFDANKKITHLIATGHDITTIKQSQKELQNLNNSLEQEVNERTQELTMAIGNLNGRLKELQLLNQVALLLQEDIPLVQFKAKLEAVLNQAQLYPEIALKFKLSLGSELVTCKQNRFSMPIRVNGERLACLCVATSPFSQDPLSENQHSLLETLRHLLEQYFTRQSIQNSLIHARQIAEQANLSKSQFLANMSHEIRTPMNAILGFSQLLHEQIQEPRQQTQLQTIINSGKALLHLINDILDLSKIEAGKLEIHLCTTNLKQMLKDTHALLALSFEQKGLSFQVSLESELPDWLELDGTRVQQILLNLLSNALKFTDQGQVELKALFVAKTNQSGSLTLSVSDTGIGIGKADQKRIFATFEQLQPQVQGGTGLGLAIALRLAEKMHASLSLNSEMSQGSVFTLHFENVKLASTPAHNNTTQPAIETHFLPACVLIADDVESNRTLTQSFLEPYPFRVYTATNGQEACQLAEKHKPDLILMDIKMPIMSGIEALRHLRGIDKTQKIPIVALTAFSLNQDEEGLRQEGFNDYLRKPFEKQELIGVLKQFLSLQSAEKPEQKQFKTSVKNQIELSDSEKKELKYLFKIKIFPAWQKLKSSFILNDLENFVSQCLEDLNQFPLPELKENFLKAQNQLNSLQLEAAQSSLAKIMAQLETLF
jgi:PAS domain S-box-containing protein